MRKADLVTAVAKQAALPKAAASHVLEHIFEQIAQAMHRKEQVRLAGFGTFLPRHRGARAGKNPQTGEPVIIGASNTVAFKPGKALREAVVHELLKSAPVPVKAVKLGRRQTVDVPAAVAS